MPSPWDVQRHPEVRAKRASKDDASTLCRRPSRLVASRRAPQGDGLHFPDPKRQELFVLTTVFERIAGLPQKIWNIDT